MDKLKELERLAEIGKAVEWAMTNGGCVTFTAKGMWTWKHVYYDQMNYLLEAYRQAQKEGK